MLNVPGCTSLPRHRHPLLRESPGRRVSFGVNKGWGDSWFGAYPIEDHVLPNAKIRMQLYDKVVLLGEGRKLNVDGHSFCIQSYAQ